MIELSKSDTETILAERHPPTLIVMAPETEISMPQVRQKRLRRRSKRKSLSSRVVATTRMSKSLTLSEFVEFLGRILTGPDKNPAE